MEVIVDSAASFDVNPPVQIERSSATCRPHLLVFSANHTDSLARSIAGYQQYALSSPHLLKDLAYNLGVRREHLLYRAFCVTDGERSFETSSVTRYEAASEVVFVFTGQGAQWTGMGQQLLQDFAQFRNDIRAMDDVLSELPRPPQWTIEGEISHYSIRRK